VGFEVLTVVVINKPASADEMFFRKVSLDVEQTTWHYTTEDSALGSCKICWDLDSSRLLSSCHKRFVKICCFILQGAGLLFPSSR
jgi:hypothetical protein